MSTELIAIVSSIIGGVLVGLFQWLTSKTSSSSHERNEFRNNILNRVNDLEKKQTELEKVVMVWKGRYWSLYTWLVNFCLTNGLPAYPPSFHEMDMKDIKEQFKKGPGNGNTSKN